MSNEKTIKYEDFILNAVVHDKVFDKTDEVPDSMIYGDKGRSATKEVPSEYSRPVAVPIFNQGNIGSCVGASGKVVVTDKHYPKEDLSALWIYKRAKYYDSWVGENYSGTSIGGACSALVAEGVCSEMFYPYVSDELAEQKEGANEDAAKRKFVKFLVLTMKDTDKIKRLIMQESLWTAFDVHSSFYQIDEQGFLLDEENYLKTENIGGHAVALVGWKEVNGKLFWRFQNSWGPQWGNNGFFYISNELYSQLSKGVYAIESHLEREDPINPVKEGFLRKLLSSIMRIVKKIFQR